MENNTPPKKKMLKDQIFELKNSKRSGKWTSDPNNPQAGIVQAPRAEQKEFRRDIKEKIKSIRKGY